MLSPVNVILDIFSHPFVVGWLIAPRQCSGWPTLILRQMLAPTSAGVLTCTPIGRPCNKPVASLLLDWTWPRATALVTSDDNPYSGRSSKP
jgi:hypothetical protein